MSALFWWMIVGHALCDYPLQGDFLARGKNHRAPLPGVPWPYCLGAHSLIHGGMVALATGSVPLGVAETVVHALTDYGKCDGRYGFHADQAIHAACKLLWAVLAVHGPAWPIS
jgi:hypothetical protein